jgi:POT family proton-dependent oligopeptide transporter
MRCFLIGLAMVIVGNGLFKPNISSMVGQLYGPGDERRDRGFTLFYMGINAGALRGALADRLAGELFHRYAACSRTTASCSPRPVSAWC